MQARSGTHSRAGCHQAQYPAEECDCRHWQYDLKHVSIDRVDTSRDGKRALVEATLTEAGSLLAPDGAVIDAYQATFTQEYELRQMRGKGWRLVASKLIF